MCCLLRTKNLILNVKLLLVACVLSSDETQKKLLPESSMGVWKFLPDLQVLTVLPVKCGCNKKKLPGWKTALDSRTGGGPSCCGHTKFETLSVGAALGAACIWIMSVNRASWDLHTSVNTIHKKSFHSFYFFLLSTKTLAVNFFLIRTLQCFTFKTNI